MSSFHQTVSCSTICKPRPRPLTHEAVGLETPVTFLEDKAFLPSAPDRGTFAWHELTYSYLDAGAIYLKHPETLGILPGERDSDIAGYDLYVMAFAHQHHCLVSQHPSY